MENMDEIRTMVLTIGTEVFIVQPIEPFEIRFIGLTINTNGSVQAENNGMIFAQDQVEVNTTDIPNLKSLPDQARHALNAKSDSNKSNLHLEKHRGEKNNLNTPKMRNHETFLPTSEYNKSQKHVCRKETKEPEKTLFTTKKKHATDNAFGDVDVQQKFDESVAQIEDIIKVEDEEVEMATQNLHETTRLQNHAVAAESDDMAGVYSIQQNNRETFDETQLLPFVCDICRKMFSEVCALNLHYVVHKYEEMIQKVQEKIDETVDEMEGSKNCNMLCSSNREHRSIRRVFKRKSRKFV